MNVFGTIDAPHASHFLLQFHSARDHPH